MIKKLSDKDKKEWQNLLDKKEKILDKDIDFNKNIEKNLVKKIDLHGFSLEKANIEVKNFIQRCFEQQISKITIITGKGLRSNNHSNPYLSKDLSILKHSVPEFIKSNSNLMKMIKNIEEAKIEEGGGGAFNVYLKKL